MLRLLRPTLSLHLFMAPTGSKKPLRQGAGTPSIKSSISRVLYEKNTPLDIHIHSFSIFEPADFSHCLMQGFNDTHLNLLHIVLLILWLSYHFSAIIFNSILVFSVDLVMFFRRNFISSKQIPYTTYHTLHNIHYIQSYLQMTPWLEKIADFTY